MSSPSSGGTKLSATQLYQSWVESNRLNEVEKRQLSALSREEIETLFSLDGSEFQFGTSGIRAIVGPGPKRLNIHTCKVFAQAYAEFISKQQGKNPILIGYDNREHGKLFAKTIYKVLDYNGIPAILSSSFMATPVLAFYVKSKKLRGGVMVTASHNPPEYNGIKLYGPNGGQLSKEEEIQIRNSFCKPEDYLKVRFSGYLKPTLLGIECFNSYVMALQKELRQKLGGFYPLGSTIIRTIPFLFSSHHGTSSGRMLKLARMLGSQKFQEYYWECTPTFLFPDTEITNPEDPRSFREMEKAALSKNIDYLIAHDPDSDRGALGEFDGKNWYYFTGNESSVLLSAFLIELSKNPKYQVKLQYKYLVTTYVSGDFLDKVVHFLAPEIKIKRTDTGFKNIGRELELCVQEGAEVLLGCEEAIGTSIFPSLSLEKDGFQQTTLCMYMIGYYQFLSKNLATHLWWLMWETKLVWLGRTITFPLNTLGKKEEIYRRLERLDETKEELQIESFCLTLVPGELPGIFKFQFKGDPLSWIKTRFSGTEPKFKLYFNLYEAITPQEVEKYSENWESFVKVKRNKLNHSLLTLSKELKRILVES